MNAEDPRPLPVPDERPARYGSAMLRRFGWFYRILGLGRVLPRVRFEEHSVDRIRQAAGKGPVVYVLLHRSTLDHLALNTVLNRRRLPLSVWSNGSTSFYWQPVREAWRDLFRRIARRRRAGPPPDPVRSGWLARAVAEGATVTIFLQEGHRPPPPEEDPLGAILEAQQLTDRPIQLVPVICVWDRAPEQKDTAVRDFLLGSRETPALFTKLANVYLPRNHRPFLQVGEPVDLPRFFERTAPERRLDFLRPLLRRFLKRESRVVRGPRLLPLHELRTMVLGAPPMRRFAEEQAAAEGVPVAELLRRMDHEFDRIAARFSWNLIRFLSIAMRPLWTQVYSGYDIRREDLDRIREAMRRGTAVLVPCHKSHFDYLLMAWVLFHDDLIVPHVVAGDNLAMPVVHRFLRAAGGFFIRRSFVGQPIHAQVFGRYLRELLLHGYTVEFFIEGGRTRSGKLLPPRLGVLEMVLETAEAAPKGHEITLLPVAIAYEQVAEEQAYQSELGGEAKRKESLGELLRARSVLKRRFGRVYLRVGEPVKASRVVAEGFKDLPPEAHRAVLKATGERLVHRIGEAMVLLPTALVAMALLAHHRQGIRHDELLERLRRLHALLVRMGAEPGPRLDHLEAAVAQALERFLRRGQVRRGGEPAERVWEIVPEERVILDFHKNQVLHFLALPALASAAIHARPADAFTADELRDDFCWLLRLMRREFVFDPDAPPEARLDEALEALEAHGALARTDEGWRVVDPARIGEVHGLVRALLESYLLVLEAAPRLRARRLDKKAFVAEVAADRKLADGAATRPEAYSVVNLQNAVSACVDQEVLQRHGDHLVAPDGLPEATALRLAPMVRP